MPNLRSYDVILACQIYKDVVQNTVKKRLVMECFFKIHNNWRRITPGVNAHSERCPMRSRLPPFLVSTYIYKMICGFLNRIFALLLRKRKSSVGYRAEQFSHRVSAGFKRRGDGEGRLYVGGLEGVRYIIVAGGELSNITAVNVFRN